jgi:hypothetical protein
MMLSLLRLCSDNDRIVNQHGAIGGMKIGKGKQSTSRKLA